jgi:hypothetical protein
VRSCRRADRRWVSPTMTACRLPPSIAFKLQTKTGSPLQHCPSPRPKRHIPCQWEPFLTATLPNFAVACGIAQNPPPRLRLQGPGPGPWRRNWNSTRHITEKALEIFKADSCLSRPEVSRYHKARTPRINFMTYQILPANTLTS